MPFELVGAHLFAQRRVLQAELLDRADQVVVGQRREGSKLLRHRRVVRFRFRPFVRQALNLRPELRDFLFVLDPAPEIRRDQLDALRFHEQVPVRRQSGVGDRMIPPGEPYGIGGGDLGHGGGNGRLRLRRVSLNRGGCLGLAFTLSRGHSGVLRVLRLGRGGRGFRLAFRPGKATEGIPRPRARNRLSVFGKW